MNALLPLNVPERVKLRVEDFYVLVASGAFAAINKVELIDGEITKVNAQYRPHSYAKNELGDRLKVALARLANGLSAQIEAMVAMPPHDAPEPDIVVTSEPRGKGPIPLASVALLVEVSDTSIGIDLQLKASLYAAHGVPEYWVVDLSAGRIVRMWQPGATGYAEADATPFGSPLAAVTIAGLVVATGGLD